MTPSTSKTILIISQVFVPDPASVGQHIADVAYELAKRNHRVLVYTSRRGFENPNAIYPARETINNVEIRRLPFASFGKKNLLLRILGTATFMTQAFFRALFTPRLAGIFFSTSPPMIGLVCTIAAAIRRVPTVYWAMDLNPDQLLALGKIKPTSFSARLLEFVNKRILKHSNLIIALDRFMAKRLEDRRTIRHKLVTIPPWPHESFIEPVDPQTNPFRLKHNLQDKFVFMYSGNHSPSNPLKTLLDAAVRLKDHPDIRFLFVGGGTGKKEVEQYIKDHNLTNVISLPYQPLADLRFSLSSADVHIVSLGSDMVGIIHPCKVYGAMAVARPILFLGPKPSHISDLLDRHSFGLHISHGDTDAAEKSIMTFFTTARATLQQMGQTAQHLLRSSLSQDQLCGQFCDEVESAFAITTTKPQSTAPALNLR
ncbi:MAG TPA: glycosyltransferase family 4 protein [Tepidisphaeraceae bacterium]|nr:glycosyltransferase family 4 protein [Tepidisphaeraceae bacterium]